MARQKIADLKAFFETGDVPTEQQYADFIESSTGGVNVANGVVGAANTYAATFALAPFTGATLNGAVIWVKFTSANTGAATLNVDGIGAANLEKEGGVPLVSGDLVANSLYAMVYSLGSTSFRIISGVSSGGAFLPLAGGTMDANAVIYGDTGNQAIYMDAQGIGLGADDLLIVHEDGGNFEKAFMLLDHANLRMIVGWDVANLDAWSSYSSNGAQLGIIQHATGLGHGISVVDLGDTDTKILAGGIQVVGASTIADYTFSPSTGETSNVSIGTKITLFKQNVNNAVSLAGDSITAKTDFVAYVNKLGFNAGEAFETLINYITATQDNLITFPNKSGTVALIVDLDALDLESVLTNGNTTADGQTIESKNGGGELDLRGDGTDNTVILSNDSGALGDSYLYLSEAYAELGAFDVDAEIAINTNFTAIYLSDAGGVGAVQITSQNDITIFSTDFTEMKNGHITGLIFGETNTGALTTSWTEALTDQKGVIVNANNAQIKQDVRNTVIIGGNGVVAKTDNMAYVSKLAFNNGELFELVVESAVPTADRTQTHQNKDGKIGLTSQTGNTSVLLTPPTITANQDDYNPTGFADATLLRVDLDANNRQITGMERPPLTDTDRVVSISNLNASNDLKFMHNNAGSLPANRFLLRDNGDKAIKPNETAQFWYDFVVGRWKPLNRVG